MLSSILCIADSTNITDSSTNGKEVIQEVQACLDFENRFKNQIIRNIESSLVQWRFVESCFDGSPQPSNSSCVSRKSELDLITEPLQLNRQVSHRFYTEIFKKWQKDQIPQMQQIIENCFMPPEPIISSNGSIIRSVQFDGHVRSLKIQNNLEMECAGVRSKWELELSQRVESAKENPSSIAMNVEEVAMMNQFQDSLAGRWLSDKTMYDPDLSGDLLRSNLYKDIFRARTRIEKFLSEIKKIGSSSNYLLYEFANQHSQFLENLPDHERTQAAQCKESSGWKTDCTGIIYRGFGRCASRLGGLGRDFLPFLPLIDSMNGYEKILAAETSGIATSEEANRKRSDLTFQFIFGLPITGLSSGLISSGIRRGSYSLSKVADLQSIRAYRSLIVRNCLPADCKLSQILTGPEAFIHIARHTPEGKLQGVRTNISDKLVFLQGRAQELDPLIQRRRDLKRLIQDPATSGRDRAKYQREFGEVRSQLRTLLESDLIELKLSRESITSIYPDQVSIESVLQSLERNTVRRKNYTQRGRASIYEVEVDRARFEVVVCRRPPCHIDGSTIDKENQLLTIYPTCGQGVFSVSSLYQIEDIIAERGLTSVQVGDLLLETPCR